MAKDADLSKKTPQELYKQITQSNLLARCKEGKVREEAHKACKSAIQEIIKRKYGNISMTFEEIMRLGTGIGCEACADAGNYARGQLDCRIGIIEEIEDKYGTQCKGSAIMKDGIIYIDPNERCPG